jgi:rRNA maturation endonuclease Nob1
MNLKFARICLDCDEVYDLTINHYCPKCGSEKSWPLTNWLNRPDKEEKDDTRSI